MTLILTHWFNISHFLRKKEKGKCGGIGEVLNKKVLIEINIIADIVLFCGFFLVVALIHIAICMAYLWTFLTDNEKLWKALKCKYSVFYTLPGYLKCFCKNWNYKSKYLKGCLHDISPSFGRSWGPNVRFKVKYEL